MEYLKKILKIFLFMIYALFFDIGAKIGVVENRVGLVSMHNAHFADSLGEVEKEFAKRNSFGGENWKTIKIDRIALSSKLGAIKFVTVDALRLGRSRFIFLNDNFMPLAYVHPNARTKVVQLWHGAGAFKKFGLAIPQPNDIRRREIAANSRLSYVVCSSDSVKQIYAEAFGVGTSKVLTFGSPNTDFYFNEAEKARVREEFFTHYPALRDKYIILYAPTFREDKSDILSHIDFRRLVDDKTAVLVRLHPQVNNSELVKGGGIDVTNYENVNDLCLVSNMLITDYSSICMDFALQDKPMVFYAYDLEDYKGARDFYFDYVKYVPGPVARTQEVLEHAIAITKASHNIGSFANFNFGHPNGTATKQLIEFLVKEN